MVGPRCRGLRRAARACEDEFVGKAVGEHGKGEPGEGGQAKATAEVDGNGEPDKGNQGKVERASG